jgi:cell division GTPase FtsZ
MFLYGDEKIRGGMNVDVMERSEVFRFQEAKGQGRNILVAGVIAQDNVGSDVLSALVASGVRGVEYLAVGVESKAMNECGAQHKIYLQKLPKMEGEIWQEDKKFDTLVGEYIVGADIVFVIAGYWYIPVIEAIAKSAKSQGALAVVLFQNVLSPDCLIGDGEIYTFRRRTLRIMCAVPNPPSSGGAMFRLGYRLKTEKRSGGLKEILKIQQQAANEEARLIVGEIANLFQGACDIGIDFQDLGAVLGNAQDFEFCVGFGEGGGENRAERAAKMAIEPFERTKAERMLISVVTGNAELSEVQKAVEIVTGIAAGDALVIRARRIDENLGDALRIAVIAGSSRFPGGTHLSD